MTMAFVTRCPYCGTVWRLPNRDTAEQGPVRCSDCQHSFDATCNLLEVPEERFPHMPAAPAQQTFTTSEPPSSTPEENQKQPDSSVDVPQTDAVTVGTQTTDTSTADSAIHKELPETIEEQNSAQTPVETNQPEAEPAQAPQTSTENDQLLRLHSLTPGEELQQSKPTPKLSKIIPAKSKPQASQPRKIRVAETMTESERRPRQRQGAFASVFTAVILLLILAAALAVIFNQKIMSVLPQTTPFFHSVCGKIPCPGFYLSDISAFVVSKTNLRAVDESGNYLLEITFINGSDMPQAIPALDIELVDDSDTTLMHKTLMPSEYLSNPPPASIAADRSITVRFSMQTNVTPARCIVNPVYPK